MGNVSLCLDEEASFHLEDSQKASQLNTSSNVRDFADQFPNAKVIGKSFS